MKIISSTFIPYSVIIVFFSSLGSISYQRLMIILSDMGQAGSKGDIISAKRVLAKRLKVDTYLIISYDILFFISFINDTDMKFNLIFSLQSPLSPPPHIVLFIRLILFDFLLSYNIFLQTFFPPHPFFISPLPSSLLMRGGRGILN